MLRLIIATRNLHKVREIQSILGPAYGCAGLEEFPGAPEVVEDAATFAGNATKKAVALARWLSGGGRANLSDGQGDRVFVLADDSGLEVDALQGAPGVNSARFAALDAGSGGNSKDTDNNAKLLRLLKDVPAEKRKARFRCVLALTPVMASEERTASPVCSADAFELQTTLFEGACEGRIGFSPSGRGGFGYDPLFYPTGYDRTFAELGPEVKNEMSHRARALEALKAALGRALLQSPPALHKHPH